MAIRVTCGAAAVLGLISPSLAGECRLALVLALDVSASVNADEDWFQQEGLRRALVAPEVVRAFVASTPVALFVFEWAGPSEQITILPWQMIDDERDLRHVVSALSKPRDDTPRYDSGTATGSALAFAAAALQAGPDCWAQTVDVSSDGENNAGVEPDTIYEWPHYRNVTVNALVIGEAQTNEETSSDADLVAWFEAEVLHGPQAFCILAQGYQDYEGAMILKLQREL